MSTFQYAEFESSAIFRSLLKKCNFKCHNNLLLNQWYSDIYCIHTWRILNFYNLMFEFKLTFQIKKNGNVRLDGALYSVRDPTYSHFMRALWYSSSFITQILKTDRSALTPRTH